MLVHNSHLARSRCWQSLGAGLGASCTEELPASKCGTPIYPFHFQEIPGVALRWHALSAGSEFREFALGSIRVQRVRSRLEFQPRASALDSTSTSRLEFEPSARALEATASREQVLSLRCEHQLSKPRAPRRAVRETRCSQPRPPQGSSAEGSPQKQRPATATKATEGRCNMGSPRMRATAASSPTPWKGVDSTPGWLLVHRREGAVAALPPTGTGCRRTIGTRANCENAWKALSCSGSWPQVLREGCDTPQKAMLRVNLSSNRRTRSNTVYEAICEYPRIVEGATSRSSTAQPNVDILGPYAPPPHPAPRSCKGEAGQALATGPSCYEGHPKWGAPLMGTHPA